MFRLDDQFLKDIGLDGLPEEQKKPFLQHIYSELELRVGTRLSDGLSDTQLEEFEKIIDRDLGFDIRFPYEHGKIYYLVICGEKKTTRVKYSDMMIRKKTGAANRKVQKLMNLMKNRII